MKIFNKKTYTILGVLAVLIFACETNLETYEDFVNEGEVLYIGAADTLIVNHGYNKIRLTVRLNSDPKIIKGTVTALDGSFTREFDIQRTTSNNEDVSVILDLEERNYTFNVVLSDDKGNKSIPKEISTTVYGEKYEATLLPRPVQSIAAAPGGTTITWGQANTGTLETILTYTDGSGVTQTVAVANNETETDLPSITFGSTFKIESTYYPEEGAFETFEGSSEQTFPLRNLALNQPVTASGGTGAYGTSILSAVDGVNDNNGYPSLYHAPNEDGVDKWLEVDLGQVYNITKINIFNRSDCCGERLSNYHVFISETPMSGTVAEIQAMPGIKDIFEIDPAGQPTSITDINFSGRYVRIQMSAAMQAHPEWALAEIEVF